VIAQNVTTDKLEIVIPAGAGGEGDYSLSITPERAGWGYSSFKGAVNEVGFVEFLLDNRDELQKLALAE